MEKPFAILFVDIADSTQLYERMGNVEAAALTRKMLRHLRLVIETNEGQVIKMTGDGLLAAFPTAEQAGWAAVAMIDGQAMFRLQLRVGLHFGPVVQGQEDLYGDACNVCARVEALAKPGEILATEDFVLLLSERLRRRTKLLNTVTVKGKSASLRIHQLRTTEVADEPTDSATAALTLPNPDSPVVSRLTLHLTYKGAVHILDALHRRLTVGREASSDLHIPSRRTSRQHAVIDFSRESFILTDHSTNGTFIRSGRSLPVALKRDSTKLVGTGLIGFGAEPEDTSQDHVAAFRCELA
ncbi:MAG TPA: adenylate/guanylate cyclase domain-containing protein [Azospirillum sp.]|nr:adenylate/guanylate cyclase domain-containing protein [Azospirillum sp.]